jgi:hypothetical protein
MNESARHERLERLLGSWKAYQRRMAERDDPAGEQLADDIRKLEPAVEAGRRRRARRFAQRFVRRETTGASQP